MKKMELDPKTKKQYEDGYNWGIDTLKTIIMTEPLNEYYPSNNYKLPNAKKEKQAETEYFESIMFKTWEKANKLEYSDFVGWMKGEDLIVSKK